MEELQIQREAANHLLGIFTLYGLSQPFLDSLVHCIGSPSPFWTLWSLNCMGSPNLCQSHWCLVWALPALVAVCGPHMSFHIPSWWVFGSLPGISQQILDSLVPCIGSPSPGRLFGAFCFLCKSSHTPLRGYLAHCMGSPSPCWAIWSFVWALPALVGQFDPLYGLSEHLLGYLVPCMGSPSPCRAIWSLEWAITCTSCGMILKDVRGQSDDKMKVMTCIQGQSCITAFSFCLYLNMF